MKIVNNKKVLCNELKFSAIRYLSNIKKDPLEPPSTKYISTKLGK
jgi:hypothetical protein